MQDRRVRKTKESIKEAFFNLMSEKPFKDITVNQITEKADVNRGTFYLHYLDKFDLRDKLEKEILNELEENIAKQSLSNMIESPEQYAAELIGLILAVIEKNQDYFKVTLIHQDLGLPQEFSRIIRNRLKNQLLLPERVDIVPIDYYFAFIVNAQTGIIKQWVKSGMKESKEEIAKYAFTLAYNGPLKLMHQYLEQEKKNYACGKGSRVEEK